jgi:hypothetical protein
MHSRQPDVVDGIRPEYAARGVGVTGRKPRMSCLERAMGTMNRRCLTERALPRVLSLAEVPIKQKDVQSRGEVEEVVVELKRHEGARGGGTDQRDVIHVTEVTWVTCLEND